MGPDPEELRQRVLSGDAAAFSPIVDEYGPMVARICRSRIRGTLAEDAVQEAFVRVWKGLGSYEPGRDFRAWIAGIAYRAAVDVIRAEERERKREAAVFTAAKSGEASAPGPDSESPALLDLYRALDLLGPDDRAAVVLHHLEELPLREVRRILGWSPARTASRLFRARGMLKKHLNGGD